METPFVSQSVPAIRVQVLLDNCVIEASDDWYVFGNTYEKGINRKEGRAAHMNNGIYTCVRARERGFALLLV